MKFATKQVTNTHMDTQHLIDWVLEQEKKHEEDMKKIKQERKYYE